MIKFLEKLFDSNEKQLKSFQPIIDEINGLEEQMKSLSDDELRNKTVEFRKILNVDLVQSRKDFEDLNTAELEKKLLEEKSQLKEILPEAFAVVREASNRVAQHRHFDVQLMAGYVLFENKIAELLQEKERHWLRISLCIFTL
mgnify:CR=1 FL=1